MKKIIFSILFTLSFFLFKTPTAHSQDICEQSGYVLSTSSESATCYGAIDGKMIVNSTGCQCFSSGCTFLWSSGGIFHNVDEIGAGAYTVTVTHLNGCILTASVSVAEPPSAVETVTVTSPQCPNGLDGKAIVIPANNAGTLTYLWSNGNTTQEANFLPAGSHAVSVTNSVGCQQTLNFNIEPPTSPVISTAYTPTCSFQNVGSASVTVQGGNPPFNFKWNNSLQSTTQAINNLAAGTYTVSITDAKGCLYTQAVNINAITPNVTATANLASVCPGTPVSLVATGGTSYTWSANTTSATISTPNNSATTAIIAEKTTFTVLTQTAEGCTISKQVEVDVKPTPNPTVVGSPSLNICSNVNNSIQLIASTPGGATFTWSPPYGLSNPNANFTVASPATTTTYTLTATNSVGCSASTAVTVTVSTCNGIENLDNNNTQNQVLNIFPNPANANQNNTVYITTNVPSSLHINNNEPAILNVYNATGQLVMKKNIQLNAAETLDVTNFTKGFYLIETILNQKHYTKKIMIN